MPWSPFTRALSRPRRPSEVHTAHAGLVAPTAETPETEQLRAELARLESAVDDLTLLVDLTREIGGAFGTTAILDTVIRRCVKAAHAEQAAITLVDRQDGEGEGTLVRAVDASGARPRFHLMAAVEGWMQWHKEPLLSNDAQTDPRLQVARAGACGHLRSLLCLPLLNGGTLTGILSVCNSRRPGGFSAADQRLLSVVAGQTAQIIENSRLHDIAVAHKRLDEQLRMAREIQLALLPRTAPDLRGYEVAGTSVPAGTMGGDYYDWYRLDPHRWALWLGDVSGKGLAASLLMANLQGALRGQISSDRKLSRSVRRAGRVLFHCTENDKFSTVFCCVLDTHGHTLTYCNAGHERPFHFHRAAAPARLAVGGVILGAFEDHAYLQETRPVAIGDVLVAYSDGVTDAESPAGEPFGDDRLERVLGLCRHEPARAIAEAVLRAAEHHTGSAPRLDDMTVMVLRRFE